MEQDRLELTFHLLTDPFNLLDPIQREKLYQDLAEMARKRRRAQVEARNTPMA